jgi:hypothetical protein
MCRRERCWTARLLRISDGGSGLPIRTDREIAEVELQTCNLPKLYKECFKERRSEICIEERSLYGAEALTCNAGVAVTFNTEAFYKGY